MTMEVYALCPIIDSKALAPDSIWKDYDTASKLADELNSLARAIKVEVEFMVLTYDLDGPERSRKLQGLSYLELLKSK